MAWVKVATVEGLPVGKGTLAKMGRRSVALFRVGVRVYAMDAECPHSGGPLAEGHVDGETVTCPWHDYRFRLDGGACLTDPSLCAEPLPVKVEGGQVLLDLPEEAPSRPDPNLPASSSKMLPRLRPHLNATPASVLPSPRGATAANHEGVALANHENPGDAEDALRRGVAREAGDPFPAKQEGGRASPPPRVPPRAEAPPGVEALAPVENGGGMRLIRAIVRPEKEFEVIEALERAGFAAMTKTDVLGRGRQRGLQVGATRYDEVAKVMLLLVVEGERVATAVEVIKAAARTGNFGDGKIFVTPVDAAYTIRTGERGL